jgi:hypothetical protein
MTAKLTQGGEGPCELSDALPLPPSQRPGADSFLDDAALELGKDAHHLKHRLAGRRRGVEALLMQGPSALSCRDEC